MASKRKTATPKQEAIPPRPAEPRLCAECKWLGPKLESGGFTKHVSHKCMHRLGQFISGTERYGTQDMRNDYNAQVRYRQSYGDYYSKPSLYYGEGQCGPEGRLWEPMETPPEPKHEPRPGAWVVVQPESPRNWWRWW